MGVVAVTVFVQWEFRILLARRTMYTGILRVMETIHEDGSSTKSTKSSDECHPPSRDPRESVPREYGAASGLVGRGGPSSAQPGSRGSMPTIDPERLLRSCHGYRIPSLFRDGKRPWCFSLGIFQGTKKLQLPVYTDGIFFSSRRFC